MVRLAQLYVQIQVHSNGRVRRLVLQLNNNESLRTDARLSCRPYTVIRGHSDKANEAEYIEKSITNATVVYNG